MQFEQFNEFTNPCRWYRDLTNCTRMKEKSQQFRQQLKPTEFVSNDLTSEVVNATFMKLNPKNESEDIYCVDEVLEVLFVTPRKKNANLIFNDDHEVDIQNLIEDCKEYLLDLNVKSLLGKQIANKTLQFFQTLNQPNISRNTNHFELNNSNFFNCSNMKIHLECLSDEIDNSTSLFDFDGLNIPFDIMLSYTLCRAKAVHEFKKMDGLVQH